MGARQRKIMKVPPAQAWSRAGEHWQCPACGKLFPRAGQSHSCVVVPLDHHFDNRPRARELFEAFRRVVDEAGGPVRLSVAKTRIGLITELTFAAVQPRRDYLRVHILLKRRVDAPRFVRIDNVPPYWVHHFQIRDETDLDEELRALIHEACEVGAARDVLWSKVD